MKAHIHIVVLLLVLIVVIPGFLISCTNCGVDQTSRSNVEVTDKLGHNYIVIEIEHSGNKHEFIINQNCQSLDLEHWPDCKYCKEYEK